jgi:hypothetical protein
MSALRHRHDLTLKMRRNGQYIDPDGQDVVHLIGNPARQSFFIFILLFSTFCLTVQRESTKLASL